MIETNELNHSPLGETVFPDQNSGGRAGDDELAMSIQPVRVVENASKFRPCSKKALDLKVNSSLFNLFLELQAVSRRQSHLASHHVDVGEPRLALHHREGLDVARGEEVVVVVEIQDDVAELHLHLGVWIGEVGQHRHVRIQQIPHVEIRGIEGGGGDVEPRATWPEYQVDYQDYQASNYHQYPEQCTECSQKPGYRLGPPRCRRVDESGVVVVVVAVATATTMPSSRMRMRIRVGC